MNSKKSKNETLGIVAYPATCRLLPGAISELLLEEPTIELSLRGQTKSVEMLKAIGGYVGVKSDQSDHKMGFADIAMMTLPTNKLDEFVNDEVEIHETQQFAMCVIAPAEDVESMDCVGRDWLRDKETASYGRGASARDRQLCIDHEVDDTLMVNAMVGSGISYGIAVGRRHKYDVAPGIVGVPIAPLEPWSSYVAARRARLTSPIVRRAFDMLVEMDKKEEPGWLLETPSRSASPRICAAIRKWSSRLGITEAEVVTRAIDLYDLALTEKIEKENSLTITDLGSQISYPINLHLSHQQ